MLKIGDFQISWLNGGHFELDAGTMFGVVPKVLWEKKYPANTDNYLLLHNDCLLIQAAGNNIVVETGIGNKLTTKQQKIFRVTRPWTLLDDLARYGLDRNDIDHLVLTHCDFDHAGGITMKNPQGELELTFPRAIHHIQQAEWQDVKSPHPRAANTYWPENFLHLEESGLLQLTDGDRELLPGITVIATGGHTRGHQILWLESNGETAVHLGDLLPNHAHFNPLWVTAFDNFPLTSVTAKEQLIQRAANCGAWFLFYHDPYLWACTINHQGEILRQLPAAEIGR